MLSFNAEIFRCKFAVMPVRKLLTFRSVLKLLPLFVLFLSSVVRAQNDHSALLKKYELFEEDTLHQDSALFYAYKVRDAAIRKFGERHVEYFRAENNIGYIFSGTEDGYSNALYHWLLAYQKLRLVNRDSLPGTRSLITGNLKLAYTNYFPDKDSAIFFTHEYLEYQKKLAGTNGREYLNVIATTAGQLENKFGVGTADAFYKKAIELRTSLFGKRSARLTHDLDSLIRNSGSQGIADLRSSLYSVTEKAYSFNTLEKKLAEAENKAEDPWEILTFAVTYKDEALRIYGDTSQKFIRALERLSNVLLDPFDLREAAIYCAKKAIDVFQIRGNTNSNQFIERLIFLAEIYSESKQFAQAITISHQQLELSRKINKYYSAGHARSLTAIGNCYSDTSVIDENSYWNASSYLTEALHITKTVNGPSSLTYGKALQTLGATCLYWARLDSALMLFETAYPIFVKQKAELYNISRQIYMTYAYKDDDAKCNVWLNKCIAIKRAKGDTLGMDHLVDLHNLTLGLIQLKDWKAASGIINRMSEILDTHHNKTGTAYLTFLKLRAEFEYARGNYNNSDTIPVYSIKLLEDPDHFKQDNYDNIRDLSSSYTMLARIYRKQGRYEESLQAIRRSVQYMNKLRFDSSAVNGDNYMHMAEVQFYLGKPDSAVFYYNHLLQLLEKDGWKSDINYTRNLMDFGTLYWRMHDYKNADSLMSAACKRIGNDMIGRMAGFSEKEKKQYNQLLQEFLHKYYSLLHSMPVANDEMYTKAYELAVQSKGLLLNTSNYLAKTISQSEDRGSRDLYDKLVKTRRKLGDTYQQSQNGKAARIDSLQTEIISLEQKLSLGSTAFSRFKSENNTGFREIQASLLPGQAAIEFITFPFYKDNQLTDSVVHAAFIILPGQQSPVYVNLKDAGATEQWVVAQGVISRGLKKKRTAEDTMSFRNIYRSVWLPLVPHLAETNTVFIAPDGILNNLSFASMQDSLGHYLIDKYQLRFVTGTRDIIGLEKGKIENTTAALFGGAFFSQSNTAATKDQLFSTRSLPSSMRGTEEWKYLPGTLTEVNAIANMLVAKKWVTEKFTGASASEINFKALDGTKAPSIIHIATHGYYFPDSAVQDRTEDPLVRTGILFASSNDAWLGKSVKQGMEDGILTAFEFANMDLNRTELVVLSACETGTGDILNGEGVYGLQRAIKQAGVKKMIVSLWPVPDMETSEMMQLFYSALSNGSTIGDSFRDAQRSMRKKYPSAPELWGAFCLIE